MSQSPGLPVGFDSRWKLRTGLAVLAKGLPELPDELDHRMSIPVAFWTAPSCAVVLFLEFSHDDDGAILPRAMMMTFARDGELWSGHDYHGGVGWSHDPVADLRGTRDLDGRAIVEGGGSFTDSPRPGHPAAVVVGRLRPPDRPEKSTWTGSRRPGLCSAGSGCPPPGTRTTPMSAP